MSLALSLSTSSSAFPEILLDDIKTITKIGSYVFTGPISIGDFNMVPIDLKRGTYNIYKLDDNLMIISDNADFLDGKTTKQKKDLLGNLIWKKNGHSVLVDNGSFGFYDTNKVTELNRLMGVTDRNKTSQPYIDFDMLEKGCD